MRIEGDRCTPNAELRTALPASAMVTSPDRDSPSFDGRKQREAVLKNRCLGDRDG